MSLPTIGKLIRDLIEKDKISCTGKRSAGAGRKAKTYVANKNLGSCIVLYYYKGIFKAAISDITGEIYERDQFKFESRTCFEVIDSLLEMITNLRNRAKSEVLAVCIGIPGVVREDGRLTSIPNISSLEDVNLGKILNSRIDIKTYIENDVNLTTVGYYHSNLKHRVKDLIYVYFGVGIGSGLILNGRLHKGANSFAGELGYLALGAVGENDNYSYSGGYLESNVKDMRKDESRNSYLNRANRMKLKHLFAVTLTNSIALINPEVIVVSGEFIDESLLNEMTEEMWRLLPQSCRPEIILDSNLDNGLNGAISLCVSNVSTGITLVDVKGV